MMEMAVVKIIYMAAVFDGDMAAARPVLMTVVGMTCWIAHNFGGFRMNLADFDRKRNGKAYIWKKRISDSKQPASVKP